MVDRVLSRRVGEVPRRNRRGGKRAGAGRRFGSVNAAKRVARARAAMVDKLPHELLLEWARTGKMTYVRGSGRVAVVELEPADRITCAKGCAAWYKPAMQPRVAPGEQPPVVRIEIDEKTLAALAADNPDKLVLLRDIFRAVQAGGADLVQTAAGVLGDSDPARYGRMLTESSDVAGRA